MIKGITTPSVKRHCQWQRQIGSIVYIVMLGMDLGPILKHHHRLALLTLLLRLDTAATDADARCVHSLTYYYVFLSLRMFGSI